MKSRLYSLVSALASILVIGCINLNQTDTASNTQNESTISASGVKYYDEKHNITFFLSENYEIENINKGENETWFYFKEAESQLTSASYLQGVFIKNKKYFEVYEQKCSQPGQPYRCLKNITVNNFNEQKENFLNQEATHDNGESILELIKLNDQFYYVGNIPNIGDEGFIRSYETFIGNNLITVAIFKSTEMSDAAVDELFMSLNFEIQ